MVGRSQEEMKTLPVIMLSARAGEEASAEGLAEGADDYLTKPFTARELLSRVASHLKLSSMRNDAARVEIALRLKVLWLPHICGRIHTLGGVAGLGEGVSGD
jgi:DNA-binding response OmpR family regulator